MDFKFIKNIDSTTFFKIFLSRDIDIESEKIFKNDDWEVILFSPDDIIYYDENHTFWIPFYNLFKQIDTKLIISASSISGRQPTIQFPSSITISDVMDKIEITQEFYDSRFGDYFFGDSGYWGVHNNHDYNLIFFGYSRVIEERVQNLLGKHPNRRDYLYYFESLHFHISHRVVKESFEEKIKSLVKNNKWLPRNFFEYMKYPNS